MFRVARLTAAALRRFPLPRRRGRPGVRMLRARWQRGVLRRLALHLSSQVVQLRSQVVQLARSPAISASKTRMISCASGDWRAMTLSETLHHMPHGVAEKAKASKDQFPFQKLPRV